MNSQRVEDIDAGRNRKPPSGHKVVCVPFKGAMPCSSPVDVMTGFLDAEGKARGRPLGVAVDQRGALPVADDVGNVIRRVQRGRWPRHLVRVSG